MPSLRS
jgi:hypothetical protein